MRKINYILLPFIVLSSGLISSCKKRSDDQPKILLSYGDMHTETVTEISGADLYQKITEDKENLMLVVSSNTCTCWAEFQPIINKYVKDNNLICYHVSYAEFESFGSSVGLVLNKSTTTFAVYDSGALKFNIHTDPENKTMSDYETFRKTMDATIAKPKIYFVNATDVDNMMKSDKNEVVYFERSGCPDCTYANKTILKDYVSGHKTMNNLYILDCQYWIDIKQQDANEYQRLKDVYGLSNKYNTDFGYDAGSFPFFSLIENGKWTAGADAFNQSLAKENDQVIVKSSYFSSERLSKLKYLEGKTGFEKVLDNLVVPEGSYSSVEYGGTNYYMWDKPSARTYYEPLITAFLDYSLAKVNYTF